MNNKVYLADLTHTENGIIALTFPLGTAFVASYARQVLGNEFDFRLFKFPDRLSQAIVDDPPLVLAIANYSWNVELGYKLSSWAKNLYPNLIVIFGGPNFPILPKEKIDFLRARSAVDFCIENEGEIGFAELLGKLRDYDFNVDALKQGQEKISNCSYLAGETLVEGGIERILDVNIIPSPYLSGAMDEFFDMPLSPMIETTRGCPFSCTFCADGIASKNKVAKFESERVRDELHYMAERMKNVDELTVTDLNFGMYKWDAETARYIAEVQAEHGWPSLIRASAGKNRPERIMETASLLKGSWVIGSSVQSSDQEVLKNIKRSNISTDAYSEYMVFMKNLDKNAKTYSEIILALPGDTKEKHFESLRYGIDSRINSMRMFQAILLVGTEMASEETREKYELLTRFRVIPGGVGVYEFGDQRVPVAEIEEIIVGSKDMPFEDYVSCRIMNLLVETYHNNALFEEVFSALWAMDILPFDFLTYLYEHDEMYTPRMREILASFVSATTDDLFHSYQEAESSALSDDRIDGYLSGELGSNELLVHKAALYEELDNLLNVLVQTAKMYLAEQGLLTDAAGEYLDQLGRFLWCTKREIQNTSLETEERFSYDFGAINELNFEVHPNDVKREDEEIRLRFFHTASQQAQIQNAVNLYGNHPGGISRMIYQQNLKPLYRAFEPV